MLCPDDLRACLPGPPDYAFDWEGLAGIRPLANLMEGMAGTPQRAEWHGEGDVWTHTRMVCEALAALPAFREMGECPRNALALAALLHDIGKIPCTRLENGKWTSPHHGPVGAQMARALLWREFGMCGRPEAQRFREAVCLLIRYHTLPLHLLEGRCPETDALRLATNGELTPLFTLRALCLLAEADVRGHIAADIPERLEQVELSRELAKEAGCLDGPYPFPSVHTQRTLFAGGSVWRDQALYDDTWGEVILLCGLPGTGKDAWIGREHPDLPTVCLDDLRRELGVGPGDDQGRVVQAAKARAKALLRAKQPFIWNATSLTARRAQQIDLFERYHARTRIVFLETEWAENLRRNAGRADAVPEGVIYGMLDRLEPPERFEARQVAWRCV